ncbi:MAG: pilus assembly PilX N-terminal domain-containing protein [Xenococcaceae cyanobacterium MO_188.B32]|nr:pilus assembly PilX N-terminal domain-containing protein [Xenococcaceae cyanobacterium MO_188.B32]
MKLLFKVFLLSRPKEEGFVLPVVIALGLIMTLVGTISIFQSSDEQLTASSQRSTSKALAAAEIGVARYRELIDQNKIIATYPACETGTWTGANCDDNGSQKSWKKATNIPNITYSCLANPASTVAGMATRDWQNISANPEDGQYRLIDYTYTSNYNSGTGTYDSQPVGTLIVEGRVNQSNTNLARDPQAAVARVAVDLPIQPGIPNPDTTEIELAENFNHFHPALWITGDSGGVADARGLEVDGNIVVTDLDDGCTQTNTTDDTKITTNNLKDSSKQSIILTPMKPDRKTFVLSTATTLDNDPDLDVNALLATDINNGITLPRPGDFSEHQDDNNDGKVDPGEEVYYHYLVVGDIDLTNESIKIVAGRKVILYLTTGDITLTANGSSNSVDINPDNPSYFLEIYGGLLTDEITFKSGSSSGNEGSININAFIHAPDATVKVQTNPKVKIKGAMWVKDWDGKDLTPKVSIEPDSSDPNEISKQYYNYTYIRDDLVTSNVNMKVDPIISVPSRWETQEAE